MEVISLTILLCVLWSPINPYALCMDFRGLLIISCVCDKWYHVKVWKTQDTLFIECYAMCAQLSVCVCQIEVISLVILLVVLKSHKFICVMYGFWRLLIIGSLWGKWKTQDIFFSECDSMCAQLMVCVCQIEMMSPVILLGILKSHKSIWVMYGFLKTSRWRLYVARDVRLLKDNRNTRHLFLGRCVEIWV